MMKDEVLKAFEVLNRAGVILYPTDTIWGLGCDATKVKTVDRIYKIKQRSESKSMIVLLDHAEKLEQYVEDVPSFAWDFIDSIDKPLTIIYPKAKNIAKNLIAADGSIAIRIVKDTFCQKLIGLLGRPIVSTSANLSGDPAPLFYNDISQKIIDAADYVVDLYHDVMKEVKPSTIIKFAENGDYTIIRD